MNAQQIFRQVYNGSKNFMTPNVIERRKSGSDVAYEISSGEEFFDREQRVYGVIVVRNQDGTWSPDYDSGQMFTSYDEAKAYVNNL